MSSTKVVLKNIRGSYVFVDETNKDGKHGMKILITKKDKKQLKAIDVAVKVAAKKKFGETVKMGKLKLPLRDPEEEEEDGKEYEGMMFLNANSGDKRPGIAISRNGKSQIADADDIETFCYSGAYFIASINFYGFDNDGNKGVAAWLSNVMIGKHGERLDGSVAPDDEFEDYGDFGEDEDDFDEDYGDL